MSLKEKVENHIIVVVFVASVSVAGTVFGASQYFHAQNVARIEHNHAQELLQVKSQLAAIDRGMPDQRYHDIRTLMYTQSLDSALPVESKYFDEDKFYAPDDIAYWHYQRSSETELIKMITGEDLPTLTALAAAGKSFPIHLWTSPKNYNITADDESLNLFPFILLQRIPFDKLPELFNIGASYAAWLEEDDDFEFDAEDLRLSSDVEEAIQNMSSIIRDDITGHFFHGLNTLAMQEALVSPNQRYRQLKLQKIGNVLYSQSMLEFREALVDGKEGSTFFLRTELILISTKNNLYLIKIVVPSLEPVPRGDAYAHVSGWLAGLRVVMD